MENKKNILLVIGRGECLRNFIYSDFLDSLYQDVNIFILSIPFKNNIYKPYKSKIKKIFWLSKYKEKKNILRLRTFIHILHFHWMNTEAYRLHHKPLHANRSKTIKRKLKKYFFNFLLLFFSNRYVLKFLNYIENILSVYFSPSNNIEHILDEVKPDFIFNCSHIHSPASDFPMKIAQHKGYKTGVFIFSWDNLTSRSRIFPFYNSYFFWNNEILNHFKSLYPERVMDNNLFALGTPQFDFHFKKSYQKSYKELCNLQGIDASRPFILYTTGVNEHFPEEHKIVLLVHEILKKINHPLNPQLVVRTYIKGTSIDMESLSKQNLDGMVFPPLFWDRENYTPLRDDIKVYSNLLRHCLFGINAASTVSLELMIFDKPIINLGFDPPNTKLPNYSRYSNHIKLDHYKPIANSKSVMIANSELDLRKMMESALNLPLENSRDRKDFINEMFDNQLDGQSANRIAKCIKKVII